MRRLLFICIGLWAAFCVKAQVTVQASLDSTDIFIGQQAHVLLKVTADSKSNVVFPVYPSKLLVKGVEILKEEVVATEMLNNQQQRSITKCYTITSFDSAFYYLPPMKVKVGTKEYESKSLALKVMTLDVDTLHLDKFFGPKGIAEVPYSWQDWRTIFWMSIVLIFMLLFVCYIALQLHNNRPILRLLRLKAVLPPHLWAMKKIEKLKSDEVRRADTKEYYSELTDVLRNYIQRRYGFNALEMTSNEIVDRLMSATDDASLDELKELFATADLAKFAKLQTQLSENDENLLRAMNFINATKVEEKEGGEEKPKIVPQEVKRSNRDRLTLKFAVAIVLILCAGLLFEICRSIYNLLY